MLGFLFFISFVNITVNNSLVLIPSGKVYNVNFNLSLPPKSDFQEVTYFQNYSYSNNSENYFTHFFINELSSQKQFSALANVIRKFKPVESLNFSRKLDSFLSPTDEIESDNPYIIELAKKITNNSIDDFEKVARIASFVYKNISYDLSTIGLSQSAVSTLLRKSGVCEGKAKLFVALSRAAGIPARYVTGITITDSTSPKLGFHSWAEVFLGKWIEVDPTWFEIATLDAGHIAVEREGLNKLIYYETYGATLSTQSFDINSTSKLNKILYSDLDYNLTYSSLSIPGNGKAIVIVSVGPFYASDVFQIPECSQLLKTSKSYSYFEPRMRNAIIEVNATNQQGSWICKTSIFGNNFFKEKNLSFEVSEPTTINKFDVKLAYKSLLPFQNQTIYITPTTYDNFTIATPCFLKKQELFPGVTYSFTFPACSNFVYVASSQTFSKVTFSFQKPTFQISEKIPKYVIEGNNFTISLNIKTNATNYKLFVEQANKTISFDLSGSKQLNINLKAITNLVNITIFYNNEIALTKIISLNLTKPSFNLYLQTPKIIVLGKNFTLNLNVSTNFEQTYSLRLIYGNQSVAKNITGNSSLNFIFNSVEKPLVVNISYLNESFVRTFQLNYTQQPQIFVKVFNQGNMTRLVFDFKNFAKNISIKIGERRWFFDSKNNTKEEIKNFGYGNFVCEISFQDIAGNFYNASFPFSNPKPKEEISTILIIFSALIIGLVIFILLRKFLMP